MYYLINESGDVIHSNENKMDIQVMCGEMIHRMNVKCTVVSDRELKKDNLINKYQSEFGLSFTHKPQQNDNIEKLTKDGKIDFFTSNTFMESTLYAEAKDCGFVTTQKQNLDYHWLLVKNEEDGTLTTLEYIEGDVYLKFIYDEQEQTNFFVNIDEE